ncbi:MAG: glycosyltransferase family 2 protein [Armatimonadetes bacterium]|jgi:glycosyltransferase involved in cell wall biosynthesis|nr:glycosyltransferase family 2 protein [Armatimonadota bacterium]
MKLSVIIPVYNEIDTIEEVLRRVREIDLDKEIIVTDDCSTDSTREFLNRQADIILVESDQNQGKGKSIRSALEEVTGDIVLIQDADLEYDPNDYHALIQPIVDGDADVVYGSRFLRGKPKMRLINYIANKVFAALASLLYGVKVSDEATCYKAFRTEVLKSIELRCNRFEFCPEVTARLLKRGYRYVEVPIWYEARTHAQGKKITWKDGVECIWTLLKYRFTG